MNIQDVISKPLVPIHINTTGPALVTINFRQPVLIRHIVASSLGLGSLVVTRDTSGTAPGGWNGNAAGVAEDIRIAVNANMSANFNNLNWLLTGGALTVNFVNATTSQINFLILYVSPKEMRVLQLIED